MPKILEEFQKKSEESRARRKTLEALLFCSITDKDFRLPTIEEFILSEVVNGTIEYVNGEAGKIDYQTIRFRAGEFEKEITDYFKEEIAKAKRKLEPKIQEDIEKLIKYEWVYVQEPGDNYPTCEVYEHFKGFFGTGICKAGMESTFSLAYKDAVKIQEILPSFTEQQRRDIEGIGKAMRKYINKDLEYIKNTYYW